MNLTQTKIKLVDNEGNLNVTPNDRRTVCSFSGSGDYTVVVNTGSAQFGDELVLTFIRGESNLSLTFPTETFLLTWCSSTISKLILTGFNGTTNNVDETSSELATANYTAVFYFDGEKFTNTFDEG